MKPRLKSCSRRRHHLLLCCACVRSDPHGEFAGKNVLIERQPLKDTAAYFGLTADEAETILARARELLHARRAQRPRPHLDDKVGLFLL